MTDVTVDQKRAELPPIDPNAQIPDAVKRRAAAVDAFYAANGQPSLPEADSQQVLPGPASPSPQADGDAVPPPPPAEPAEPAKPQQAEPPVSDDDEGRSWEERFKRMHGRYTAAQKTIGEMQEQMSQLGEELIQRQSAPQPGRPRATPPPKQYITQQDVQNYGTDLLDFTQRAAIQAVAPRLEYLQGENEELRQQLAREARMRLDMAVRAAIPNLDEIERDPRWHQWLSLPEPYSGRIRQELLNDAIALGNASRVLSFFRGFQQEQHATGQSEPQPVVSAPAAPPREPAIPLASLAAPGRARPSGGGDTSVPPDKPTYTRAQIAQLYEAKRRGLYAGREAEWNRQEADLYAAQREGRVRT